MTTKYDIKLKEIGAAKNSSRTASRVRGVKWTSHQISKMRHMASLEQAPTIELVKSLYPNLGDYKSERMLHKVKQFRKEFSEITGLQDAISGVRSSKGKGLIYLVENESYSGWIKCGMTIDMKNRLNSYNCNDPLKRFRVLVEKEVKNRRKSETVLKYELQHISSLVNGEWFRVEKEVALKIFSAVN